MTTAYSRPAADTATPSATGADTGLCRVLVRYYDELAATLDHTRRSSRTDAFSPGWDLPPLSPALEVFLAPAAISAPELGTYGDTRLTLLNLMHNPDTRTTKTLASLMIVARAVAHIQRTGEAVMIITPSSANKATALRDAVRRAHETALAGPEQLRIVCVLPVGSCHKVWRSPLTDDEALRARNPLAVRDTTGADEVKKLARAVADQEADAVFARHGVRLWHTLDLDNYIVADTARALFERDRLPSVPRVHAHAVSSAFGLLGHFYGQQRLTGRAWPDTGARYFLVQHLDTADMVASYHRGAFDYRPAWQYEDGVYTQDADPRFPQRAFAPDERLDPTFYTRAPVTSTRMNEIIRHQGGGGIVVSLAECLDRYPYLRRLLAAVDVELPADPRQLREWSLVMALTGVLNALDRGLLDGPEVLVHGSGSYHAGHYRPPESHQVRPVTGYEDLRDLVHAAASG
ncbi:hypothetical protein C9F11_01885 [Streptomyces sp. YIM 121038]|uniref:DUF6002 family protein n=1 Tax=Streptomyces sp. YIM 121038 TaxID=2136401 RepID=UPI001110ABC1|nr:DUF6002 family protein [Streptomyces sp. YIM 121038]QCX74080.1 hypothetical protein C9F11_01885 [Streptomyces sp. YIM 121038]